MSLLFTWPHSCQPKVLLAGRFPFSPATVAREYRHPTFALHQHHYRGRVVIGRKAFDLRPGDVTLTPPGVISRYQLGAAGRHWCVHFAPMTIPEARAALKLPLCLPMRGGGGRITGQMRMIAEMLETGGSRARKEMAAEAAGTMLQSLLLQLALEQTASRPRRRESRAEQLLDAAKDLIEQHFQQPLTIENIARASGLSRNYFSARFRARFGRTAQGYLLHRRLEAARVLLISTELPVKEIAFECGLPDPHHFNKQFRHAEGVSPTGYRERHSQKW